MKSLKIALLNWHRQHFTVTCANCGKRYRKSMFSNYIELTQWCPKQTFRAYACSLRIDEDKHEFCSVLVQQQLEHEVLHADPTFYGEAIAAPRVMRSMLDRQKRKDRIRHAVDEYYRGRY